MHRIIHKANDDDGNTVRLARLNSGTGAHDRSGGAFLAEHGKGIPEETRLPTYQPIDKSLRRASTTAGTSRAMDWQVPRGPPGAELPLHPLYFPGPSPASVLAALTGQFNPGQLLDYPVY